MRYLIVLASLLLVGCVVAIPHGRLQFACDRSITERPQHLHCDRRFPVSVAWKFK